MLDDNNLIKNRLDIISSLTGSIWILIMVIDFLVISF